jgi:NAD(P)-dependent dehydrogenase (short-subunit alcohol dehydrogenase family)
MKGRTAVITGGGSGIGAAAAKQLAAQGASVVVTGRRKERLDEVVAAIAKSGGSARAVVCDVAKPESVAAMAKDVGSCDILVNNAGIAKSAPLAKTDDALWAETLAINLTGTFLCTRAFLPDMVKRGWGRVVNVASIAGKAGMQYTSAYCASKHGVLGFTRAVALECARKGVTVNAVCPGWVDTEMTDHSVAVIQGNTKMTEADARAFLAGQSPQNRLMTADEVAALVVYLCGEAAGGITAQAMNVDGGQLQS